MEQKSTDTLDCITMCVCVCVTVIDPSLQLVYNTRPLVGESLMKYLVINPQRV